eukprot:Nk52_evm15s621 gene=Nk52_evmTU15s621
MNECSRIEKEKNGCGGKEATMGEANRGHGEVDVPPQKKEKGKQETQREQGREDVSREEKRPKVEGEGRRYDDCGGVSLCSGRGRSLLGASVSIDAAAVRDGKRGANVDRGGEGTGSSAIGASGIASSSSSFRGKRAERDRPTPVISPRRRHSIHYYSPVVGEEAELLPRGHRRMYNRCPIDPNTYESLNYDVCDNELYLRRMEKLGKTSFPSLEEWALAFVVGCFVALVGFVVDVSVVSVTKLKFELLSTQIQHCTTWSCLWTPLMFLMLFNLLLAVGASLLTILEPVAAGSGVPEIKCYLNGVVVPHVMRLKTLLIKVSGVILTVASGVSAGKEGPMIHSGAIIGGGVCQGRSTTFPWVDLKFKKFRNDRFKRDFVSCGAAAGVAAAFGAPIGGVLFALEEGCSFWNQKLTWRTLFCSMTSTFALNFLLSGWKIGSWGTLSNPGLLNFGSFDEESQPLWTCIDIFIFIGMGAIGGVLGAVFNAVNSQLANLRMKHLIMPKRKYALVLEMGFIVLVTTMLTFGSVVTVGECLQKSKKDICKATGIGQTRDFFCPEGYFNDMATLVFNSQEDSIKLLFHTQGEFSVQNLIIFFVLMYFLSAWTYGCCAPVGIFVPTLISGAAFGRLFGIALQYVFPSYEAHIYTGTYALIGAAALLGGVVRMTLSLTIILIESTNNITYGLPLMITLMVAKWVGDCFTQGIYDIYIELRNIPYLEWEPEEEMKTYNVQHVMTSDVKCLPYRCTAAHIYSLLSSTTHNAFPVVDVDLLPVLKQCVRKSQIMTAPTSPASYLSVMPNLQECIGMYSSNSSPIMGRNNIGDPFYRRRIETKTCGVFLGVISRQQLTVMLQKKSFVNVSEIESRFSSSRLHMSSANSLTYDDFYISYPRYAAFSEVNLRPQDLGCVVDLREVLNPNVATVKDVSPLPRVFNVFRTMGLRHLPVVNIHNYVVGIVTRKDLTGLEYKDSFSEVSESFQSFTSQESSIIDDSRRGKHNAFSHSQRMSPQWSPLDKGWFTSYGTTSPSDSKRSPDYGSS